jgi:hypothetical protein
LLVRTNALWRIAKAATERPIEVRNIGKASVQCDGKQTTSWSNANRSAAICAQMAYSDGAVGFLLLPVIPFRSTID